MHEMSIFVLLALLSAAISTPTSRVPKHEKDPEYWYRQAEQELREALNVRYNTNPAKNIILFVGDGMGVSTVTAARIFKGQLAGKPGEETVLAWEDFPHTALSKTYNIDHQIPDSAATATAFLCGVKANYGTMGVSGHVPRGHCRQSQGRNLTCIAQLAQKYGKSTGLVTGSRVSHATPAPLYAATADRMWECSVPHHAARHGCRDVAAQIMSPAGQGLNVVLGGGRYGMMPNTELDPEYPTKTGCRSDGRNLIDEWVQAKRAKHERVSYVWNQKQFDDVDPDKIDNLMGLFEPQHMQYEWERAADSAGEPSLAQLVDKAIRVLRRNDKGYFLLVEGARIDHGHHYNTARKALEETIALEAAVEAALKLVNLEDTLLIVTADHSHPLTIGSYARRGNPILGLTDYSDEENQDGFSYVDRLPYTTLSYANGPGYVTTRPRPDLSNVNTDARDYMQVTSVPERIVSHDGSDVTIHAIGPFAHLFNKVHEQHYIFHVMVHAACMGPDTTHCPKTPVLDICLDCQSDQHVPQRQVLSSTATSSTANWALHSTFLYILLKYS